MSKYMQSFSLLLFFRIISATRVSFFVSYFCDSLSVFCCYSFIFQFLLVLYLVSLVEYSLPFFSCSYSWANLSLLFLIGVVLMKKACN